MKTKKMMALLLVLVFTISSVVGCSRTKSTNSTDTPTSAPSETTAEVTTEPAEELVTLTIWADNFEKSFPAGVQNDPVAQEITKRTGVIMDISPGNSFTDYKQMLAASLASGDLPDIFTAPTELQPMLISAKAILPLDEYLEANAPAFINETPERYNYQKTVGLADADGNKDGHIYTIPLRGDLNTDPLQVQVAPYLRWDLYKELGYPEINSMDDYIPILKKMMELEPTNKDGKKNYGISGWFGDWGNWVFGSAFGMMYGTTEGVVVANTVGTNKVYGSYSDPNSAIWKGLEWYNKAFRAGIMDPDAPTMKWDQFLEKTKANRVFFALAPWQIDNGNATFIEEGTPEKGYVQMPLAIPTDKYMIDYNQPYGGMNYFISANCKYPEKAVQLLDFLLSIEGTELIYNGVEGVNYDIIDGKPVMRQETVDGLANEPEYKLTSGVYKYHNLAGRGKAVVDPKLNVPVYFMYQEQYQTPRLTSIMKDAAAHYNVALLGDLYSKNPAIKHTISQPVPNITEPKSDELKAIETKIINYFNDNYLRIMLSKSQETFDTEKEKFISDLKTIGIDQLVQWTFDQYNKLEPGKYSLGSLAD